jgi:hypothetical protein
VIELAASSVGLFQVLYLNPGNRGQTSAQFVRDLSTKFRYLRAVTLQLNTGKSLKIKKSLSGI